MDWLVCMSWLLIFAVNEIARRRSPLFCTQFMDWLVCHDYWFLPSKYILTFLQRRSGTSYKTNEAVTVTSIIRYTTNTMAMSSDGIFFTSGVDELSETEVLDAVNQLNYCIDNLMLNITAADESSHSHCNLRKPTVSDCDATILAILNNSQLSDRHARDFVVENHLRNLICTLLHTHFFDGHHFSAVGSETLRSETLRQYLDRMITVLIEGGKLCPF